MEDNGDPLRYDELLLTQLNEVGSRVTTFAITNYAASGAIFLAFFATKLQSWVILVAVIIVNCNFVIAIAHNIWPSVRIASLQLSPEVRQQAVIRPACLYGVNRRRTLPLDRRPRLPPFWRRALTVALAAA